MHRYIFAVLVLVCPLVSVGDVSVSGAVSVRDGSKSVDVVFSNHDRMVISDYYHVVGGNPKPMKGRKVPPGLAKKGGLPPGIAKKQHLPATVTYELLPRTLEAKLPPLPSPNYIRVKVGRDFAILDRSTRVVMDVALGLD